MLGASGAAIAVGCPEGRIISETVDEIVVNGQPCLVYETVVEGQVLVTNSPQFEITFSEVGGPISIQGVGAQVELSENVTVLRTDILLGNLTVTGFETAIVAGNTLNNGNLTVNNNLGAVVVRNAVNGIPPATGNIECTGNIELESPGNRAAGVDNCIDEVNDPNL